MTKRRKNIQLAIVAALLMLSTIGFSQVSQVADNSAKDARILTSELFKKIVSVVPEYEKNTEFVKEKNYYLDFNDSLLYKKILIQHGLTEKAKQNPPAELSKEERKKIQIKKDLNAEEDAKKLERPTEVQIIKIE